MVDISVNLRVTYDPEVNAAYIYLTDRIPDGGVAYGAPLDDPDLRNAVNVDVNHVGEVVGIEVLDVAVLSSYLRGLVTA